MFRSGEESNVKRRSQSLFDDAPIVERLEDRLLLAGSIRVSATEAGDLTIRGDGGSNYVEVAVEATDQNDDGDSTDIVIRGIDDSWGGATTIRVGRESVSQVIIDSPDGSIPGQLNVKLRGGDDFIAFRGVTISGAFEYRPGGKSDTLGIFDSTVDGASDFRTSGGNDYINIVDTTFNGPLSVNTGSGVDFIGLTGFSLASGQTATFITGGSPDVIYIEDSTVDGNIIAETGGLIDTIYVGDGTILNGSVDVDMGSLFDLLVLENNVGLNGPLNIDGGRSGYYLNQLFLYHDSPYIANVPSGVLNFETTRWTISGVDTYVGLDMPTTLSRWVMDIYGTPVINVVDAIVAASMARGFEYGDLPRSNVGSAPNPAELKDDINAFLGSSEYYRYQKAFLKRLFQDEVTRFNWYDNSGS